jgi:hypothetical protein
MGHHSRQAAQEVIMKVSSTETESMPQSTPEREGH